MFNNYKQVQLFQIYVPVITAARKDIDASKFKNLIVLNNLSYLFHPRMI